MEACEENEVSMHIFRVNEIFHMVLTDVDFTKVIGEL